MEKPSVTRWITPMMLTVVALAANASPSNKLSQFPEGERLVYARIVQAFQLNKMEDLVKERSLLERTYPTSIHLDNAYYLTGMLEYQNGHLGEALKAFDVVRDKYWKSNKRPAALFGIAMTYQRLNLFPQAHRVFEEMIREYPGSPESQRAAMQLQLEKEGKTTKR